MNRKLLHIDLETFSERDLRAAGLYRYAEDPSTEILIAAWAVDDGPVLSWHQGLGIPPPPSLLRATDDPAYMKIAHHAPFERTLLRNVWGLECDPEQWFCTKVLCLMAGRPGGLGEAAHDLELPQQKGVRGMQLIRMFSMLQQPTETQPLSRFNWRTHPVDWATFVDYCEQDVRTERGIHQRLHNGYYLSAEHRAWIVDQRINDRGVAVDTELALAAIDLDERRQRHLMIEARLLGIKNPKSVAQVKDWLVAHGYKDFDTESLSAKTLRKLLETADPTVQRGMELRLQLSKTSVTKYRAVVRSVCRDGRLRGMYQFYGAQRTGRWSANLVQTHNLKRNSMEDLDEARRLVKARDWATLEAKYDDLSDVLSQLIRTVFVAATGTTLHIADFSAIEAVVLAWLAHEEWRLEVFRTHGKIYEASAAAMFKVAFETIVKGHTNYALRQKGKIAELALGFGGARGALITMGALDMGLTEEELPELVRSWRAANQKIVAYWYEVERAFKAALNIGYGEDHFHTVTYRKHPGDDAVICTLPSGRYLTYPHARIRDDDNNPVFWGKYKDSKKFGWQELYGGKLVENIVQATARDLLSHALQQLEAHDMPVIMHVHDEAIREVYQGGQQPDALSKMVLAMTNLPVWAKGLPLKAAGYETPYYRKED